MSPLRLNGATSGYCQLDVPAVSGTSLLTVPAANGTLDRLERAGNILQVVNYQTGTRATGTGQIPLDNTIPQNTEGTEFMSLAITPTSSTNKLIIDVVAVLTGSAVTALTVALFQDSTVNALASSFLSLSGSDYIFPVMFRHYMTSGTTSSTTFKVRAGLGSPGTTAFNGNSGASYMGGTLASSITIREIAA